jgi:hypothetical protein
MRSIFILLTALAALTLQGAERYPNGNASGDCGRAVPVERTHRWNPLKVVQHLDDKMAESAIKLSTIGIPEPAPACTPVRASTASVKRSETAAPVRAEAKRTETVTADE